VEKSGWVIFPHIHLDYLAIIKKKHHKNIIIKKEVRVTPSAQYDFRNTKIVKNSSEIIVYTSQGLIYHYANKYENIFVDEKTHSSTQIAHYLLSKEILPKRENSALSIQH